MQEVDLIANVQKGDMEAFEQLFELKRHRALRTVYLMTRDKDISQDIVQEYYATLLLRD